MLTYVVLPKVLEWHVSVPPAEEVEELSVQHSRMLRPEKK